MTSSGPGYSKERERFKLYFGYIFSDCSDTMIQKCWRRFAQLPATQRGGLLAELETIALAKANNSPVTET
jgi:hypothetical protein